MPQYPFVQTGLLLAGLRALLCIYLHYRIRTRLHILKDSTDFHLTPKEYLGRIINVCRELLIHKAHDSKRVSRLVRADVPYFIMAIASSVVNFSFPFNLSRILAIAWSISAARCARLLLPVPPTLLHESKSVDRDEASRRGSLTISAADDQAWTELAWTAMSIWERVSDSFLSCFFGGCVHNGSSLACSSAALMIVGADNMAGQAVNAVARSVRRGTA